MRCFSLTTSSSKHATRKYSLENSVFSFFCVYKKKTCTKTKETISEMVTHQKFTYVN